MDELKKASILTKDKIIKLKEYISKKYPNNSPAANASILAKIIHEIIDKSLEGLDSPYNNKIRSLVIKNSFMNNDHDIFKIHIVEAAIPFAERDANFKRQLIKWINFNEKNIISEIEFDRIILKKNDNDNMISNEVSVEGDAYKAIPKYIISEVPPKKTTQDEKENNSIISKLFNMNVIDGKKLYEYKDKIISLIYNLRDFLTKDKISSLINVKKLKSMRTFISKEKLLNVKHVADIEVLKNKWERLRIINIKKNASVYFIGSILLAILLIGSIITMNKNKTDNNMSNHNSQDMAVFNSSKSYYKDITILNRLSYHPHLPEYFNYKDINTPKLKAYLNERNSILVQEPYFSSIIDISKEFNLNPLILFAITGQEQGFVSRDNKNANKIANNPFNVFHSWEEYNTNIRDSSRIAARTVINLALNRPSYIDPFTWINKEYAEDNNWGKGVKELYQELVNATK